MIKDGGSDDGRGQTVSRTMGFDTEEMTLEPYVDFGEDLSAMGPTPPGEVAKRAEHLIALLDAERLPELHTECIDGNQDNPEWESENPAILFNIDGDNIDPSSGINVITQHGKVIQLPDDYFSHASVVPQDNSSSKRPWEGIEVKHRYHKRWSAFLSGEYDPKRPLKDVVLDLTKLKLVRSKDQYLQKAGNSRALKLKLGDPNECALFATGPPWKFQVTQDGILWALATGIFDRSKLLSLILFGGGEPSVAKKHWLARRALATVLAIYCQFSKATMALKVIERPLLKQHWTASPRHKSIYYEPNYSSSDNSYRDKDNGFLEHAEDINEDDSEDVSKLLIQLCPFSLERGETFALLAAFESGSLNPDPSTLSKVMAMSSGDSIFVAAQLLIDPLDSPGLNPSSISKIRGNIGKPGVAMLISPPELQVRPRNSANWRLINHAPFNSELIDSFQGTSLHLSFTEYSRPMDVGVHDVRDADIYFLEAYVQVFFKGQWIGDADIISSLESEYIDIFDPRLSTSEQSACEHQAKCLRAFRLVAIDSWDEFVDSPSDEIIVRARNNWLARLAAASLSAQRQQKTIVMRCDDEICWPCVRDKFELKS